MDLFKLLKNKSSQSGFSIPELMVSIGIITVVTTILLFRFNIFNSTTLLNSQAYEIALDMRQAQVAGISVQGNDPALFEEEYGVHFDLSAPLGTKDRQYIFFRDNDSNGERNPARYDDGEGVDVMLLDARFRIAKICVNDINADCVSNNLVEDLTISFKRPNFDALFYSSTAVSGGINTAIIVIETLDGTAQKSVLVSSTGQISVQ